MNVLARLQAAALAALDTATGSPHDSDDVGMFNADADDLFAWCDDLESRVGLDVTEFRAAVLDYVIARDGETDNDPAIYARHVELTRGPSDVIYYAGKAHGILPPVGERRETFQRIMRAGKAAFPFVDGLTYVTPGRAYFQRTGDATRYSIAITPEEFATLTGS